MVDHQVNQIKILIYLKNNNNLTLNNINLIILVS